MTRGGFLDQQKRTNKIGLTLVIAGHAAALTAIALAPPETVNRIIYMPLKAISIDDPAPPPAAPPEPVARSREPERATTTDPIVTTNSDPVLTVDAIPLPRVEPLPPVTPTVPEPVFLPATIEPAAMARFQPDYPPELIRAEIEGTATVRVLIGSDGRVKTVEMVTASHPGFFEATRRQALRYWRFRPATRDGAATESWRTMTVRFTIQS